MKTHFPILLLFNSICSRKTIFITICNIQMLLYDIIYTISHNPLKLTSYFQQLWLLVKYSQLKHQFENRTKFASISEIPSLSSPCFSREISFLQATLVWFLYWCLLELPPSCHCLNIMLLVRKHILLELLILEVLK